MTTALSHDAINDWADNKDGPVALHLKQTLLPVEGEGGVIFPPTYADIGYNIDTLSDGTKVATIDSVGAQANRIEPIFKEPPYADLVPQIEIIYGNEKTLSILDVGHRLGDAIVRCTALKEAAKKAFEAFQLAKDASPIAKLAPTSLVFGVWDSRGTQAKLPRILQSVIRAWDVELLTRSAQYFPPVDYTELDVGILKKDKKATNQNRKTTTGKEKNPEAKEGYAAVPAVKSPGGVIARGGIEHTLTINLIALRRLDSGIDQALRRYVLGLSLVAATAPLDPFLRQGCLIVPDPVSPAEWSLVDRQGARQKVVLTEDAARSYAEAMAKAFGVGENRKVYFDKELAMTELPQTEDKVSGKKKAS